MPLLSGLLEWLNHHPFMGFGFVYNKSQTTRKHCVFSKLLHLFMFVLYYDKCYALAKYLLLLLMQYCNICSTALKTIVFNAMGAMLYSVYIYRFVQQCLTHDNMFPYMPQQSFYHHTTAPCHKPILFVNTLPSSTVYQLFYYMLSHI